MACLAEKENKMYFDDCPDRLLKAQKANVRLRKANKKLKEQLKLEKGLVRDRERKIRELEKEWQVCDNYIESCLV